MPPSSDTPSSDTQPAASPPLNDRPPIRFVMIGGFLGAGKTTIIGRIAHHYMQQGKRVGIVTNDQAHGLVDTQSLRNQGLHVGEVPGACFCCKFDDLVATVGALQRGQSPDVVIAEPVGSCTDLVATVIEPLRNLHHDRFRIAPFAVLLKPEHGRKILREDGSGGFSPQAAYIFLKQLEEAELIVVNKVDKLSSDLRAELLELLQQRFPEKKVLSHSSQTGEGFEALLRALDQPRSPASSTLEIDYDTYAAGEAELGWLNAHYVIAGFDNPTLSLSQIVEQMASTLASRFEKTAGEIAHLKILAEELITEGTAPDRSSRRNHPEFALANLVGSDVQVELSAPSERIATRVRITVNARIAMSPDELVRIVRSAWSDRLRDWHANGETEKEQFFRPGRPTPTHRISASE